MIYEWKPAPDVTNFGDRLGALLLPPDLRNYCETSNDFLFCPIGSVINNAVLAHADYLGLQAVFTGCGWDGSALDANLLARARFFGVRGFRTQSELARHGIETHVVGDPGYALPLLFPATGRGQEALLVRHGLEVENTSEEALAGVTKSVSAFVKNDFEIWRLANEISSSRFVLASSLHAAIAAHAYGIPFAPYKSVESQFVDHPLKWVDWLSSIGIDRPFFASDVGTGLRWYRASFSRNSFHSKSRFQNRFIKAKHVLTASNDLRSYMSHLTSDA